MITIRENISADKVQLKVLSLTRRGRRLYVNLTVEVEREVLAPTGQVVGIDLGVSERLVCSDAKTYERRVGEDAKIKQLQRRLARQKKGSLRHRKLKATLANGHQREPITNRNECHRMTTEVVRSNDVIVMEDIKILNMTASASGTEDAPGENVRQKAGLNREILKQSWGMIQTQIGYKAENAGRLVLKVDPRYSSQTCSGCLVVEASNKPGKRYCCSGCGQDMDADLNASINLLTQGLATMPGGIVPGAVAITA